MNATALEGTDKPSRKSYPLNKLKGMLWGLVIGDCMGSPIQFFPKDNHPAITKIEPAIGVYGRDLPKGYWTDDASMAFCIMESYIRLKRYDLSDIAKNFVRWHNDGFLSSVTGWAFDIGHATSLAVRGILSGNLVNGEEDSQGNGTIIRLAPSLVISEILRDPQILIAISDLTHHSESVHKTVVKMAAILRQHLSGERTQIPSIYKTRDEVNNSGWCVSTLEAALWAFQYTSSFKDGMLLAVNLAGDSDSIGAVYGQLAGAYYGLENIPSEWMTDVKNWRWVDVFIDDFLRACHMCD